MNIHTAVKVIEPKNVISAEHDGKPLVDCVVAALSVECIMTLPSGTCAGITFKQTHMFTKNEILELNEKELFTLITWHGNVYPILKNRFNIHSKRMDKYHNMLWKL